MARTREQRGEQETKAAVAKVKKTGKATGGARGGITAPGFARAFRQRRDHRARDAVPGTGGHYRRQEDPAQ